jgi:enamine deaminase RidA (YjgF/YER057c/UK114 family)
MESKARLLRPCHSDRSMLGVVASRRQFLIATAGGAAAVSLPMVAAAAESERESQNPNQMKAKQRMNRITTKDVLGSRLSELGIVLPAPPTPLGAYVEASDTGNLLFLSGTLPVVNRKLAISGRLGENLSVKEGQEAARIASLNALAVAKEHLGDLDRLKKLVKLTVLVATTDQFVDHAPVADGASDLFVKIFGPETGHVRLVYGVQSLPIGAPVIVDVIFEIEPMRHSLQIASML